MIFEPLKLDGLYRVTTQPITDDRGAFARQFCARKFEAAGLNSNWVQMNISDNKQTGTVRGFHFQRTPFSEIKMVKCLRGQVFDVAVDLRAESPTFGQWFGEILSPEAGNALYIPQGFAHGFQTLTDDCQLIYWHSEFYTPDSEGGINVMDPTLKVEWPIEIVHLSDRDRNLPNLSETDPIAL